MIDDTAFVGRIREVHGEVGAAWLARLPALMDQLSEAWNLTVGRPFVPLSYGFVTRAKRTDGTRVVLKLRVPGVAASRELAALQAFEGRGAVRVLEHDKERGALLLERLDPGSSLAGVVYDDRATRIAAGLMKRLAAWPPETSIFPTVSEWGQGFARHRRRHSGGSGPLPHELFVHAENLFTELDRPARPSVLLHGDLHHLNILAGERESWLCIDPQGVIGDPAFEVGALLRNPVWIANEKHGLESLLARRLDQLAEVLGIERFRLSGWAFAQAVLSACWMIEDHGGGWEGSIHIAQALARAADRR